MTIVETSNTFAFLVTFGLAAIAWLLLNRFRWFRRLSGNRDIFEKQTYASWEANAIGKIGTKGKARQSFKRLHFASSWGARLLTLGLTIALFFVIERDFLHDFGLKAQSPAIMGFAALAIWHNIYIWSYSVEISEGVLSYTSYFLARKKRSLNELKCVETTNNGGLILLFSNGDRTEILRYLQGIADLELTLNEAVGEYLQRNGTPNSP